MISILPSGIPRTVAWLGFGGLIPFAVLAAACVVDRTHPGPWHLLLVGYGAVILSFVGALHWGFAMTIAMEGERRRTGLFVWSVVPSLIAWIAIALPASGGYWLLIAGFCAHYWRDAGLATKLHLPGWYLPLRLRLTLVASLCLAIGAVTKPG